jgi:release factor glutamine methyltransferase
LNVAAALAAAGIDAREARLLLADALGISVASAIANPDRELTASEAERFRAWTARRALGEPIAYILGRREFHALVLAVSPAVLIPRPESELLVDLAIERRPRSVLDLGTGSGAIALAIKRALPSARVVAVDTSAEALAVARRNATALGLEVDLREGNWFDPVAGERFDLIVANPPYVAAGDSHLLEGDLRFEPPVALVSSGDGLDSIREIVSEAANYLAAGGWFLTEHGLGQDPAVRVLLEDRGFGSVASWRDLAGIARVSGGRLKSD